MSRFPVTMYRSGDIIQTDCNGRPCYHGLALAIGWLNYSGPGLDADGSRDARPLPTVGAIIRRSIGSITSASAEQRDDVVSYGSGIDNGGASDKAIRSLRRRS